MPTSESEAVMPATPDTLAVPSVDAITEQFDPVACVSSRDRSRAVAVESGEPGSYLEVQGPVQALRVPLGDDVLHVGRGISADLQLDDSSVSRRHAVIIRRGEGAQVLDDRSLNGTFVNGRRIEHVDLRSGDIITMGRFELRYVDV
jgi:hypothetical protein